MPSAETGSKDHYRAESSLMIDLLPLESRSRMVDQELKGLALPRRLLPSSVKYFLSHFLIIGRSNESVLLNC